jgi:hypothetical protein
MLDNTSRNAVQRERQRLGQVRKAFAAGIEQQQNGKDAGLEFFSACVDYIRASMDRLHAQDQRIHDLLMPHVKASDTTMIATLDNLNSRLARSRVALNELTAARDAYRTKGKAGWADFKAAIDLFMDIYFNVLMKGQHSTLEFQKQVFSDTDWSATAGVTEDALIKEATLFAEVRRHAPAGADPASFHAGPPVV